MTDLISSVNSKIGSSYKTNVNHSGNVLTQSFRGKGHGHLYGSLFTALLWETIKSQSGFRVHYSDTKHTNEQLRQDNAAARSMINCNEGLVIPTHGMWQIGGSFSDGWSNLQNGCVSGSFFLDDACKLVDKSDVDTGNLCGNMRYSAEMATPISLIWSEEYKNLPSSIVNFKLNPYSDNSTWLWRGSEALPLLVYDPDHTGVITSASQLFGNWTFGGNGLASLINNASENTPWRDGYQALQSLDMNNDGKISDSELDDLALWFDYNKDGISQPGEVVSLSSLSVTALFFEADKEEKGAKIATLGFERLVEGKTVTGSSMDWSEKSLHDGLGAYIEENTASSIGESGISNSKADTSVSSEFAKKNSNELSGLWAYAVDSPMQGSGYLAFDSTEEGMIGASLLPVIVEGSSVVQNQVMFNHFEVLIGDEKTARFEYKASNGSDIQNTVTITEDGSLKGKTVVSNSEASESGRYEYTWTALKVE